MKAGDKHLRLVFTSYSIRMTSMCINLWHVSLELLMYIYMFYKLKCYDLKWLRTGTEIEFTGL